MGTQNGQQTVAWQHSLGLRVKPGETSVAHTEAGQETEGSRVLNNPGDKHWDPLQGRETVDEATLPGDGLRRGMKMERKGNKKQPTHSYMHTAQPTKCSAISWVSEALRGQSMNSRARLLVA